ncbi:hypothetical protein [Salinicoccus halodurans]|uniref:Uncharacterized protein n=1 Tax=Salinicoccus halodurans TaxID=407035 RepID=A0A0F7HM98_9STAP|nr:hypothetical protein [Salinicoccus halodurans]AKG74612.1 hypothetical protein AAT16_10670 [Salinicoccus halodurans]SFK89230.1 hypothetical protein SAMN05216235_2321 [Salinicoccus halodurans]
MFYNLIYFNEDLYDTYYTFANAGQAVQFKEIESQTDKGGQLGFNDTHVNLGKSSVLKGEIINNAPSKLISLEKSLEDNDFYMDFESGESLSHIEDLTRRMIFKATLPLEIHAAFDMHEIFHLLNDQLKNLDRTGIEHADAESFNTSLDFSNIKLPVYNDQTGKIIFSKIHKNCLLIEENELDELGEDNIILAKVKKIYRNEFTLFDPLKDFINLNNSMRSKFEESIRDNKILAPITITSDAIEVEIIAIYS